MIAFTQPDTGSGKICFTTPVAKAIAIDLVRGDSATAELKATQTLLIQTETKCIILDSTNQVYQHKQALNLLQLGVYQEKTAINEGVIATLTADNKRLRFQLKVGVISVSALLVVGVLIK